MKRNIIFVLLLAFVGFCFSGCYDATGLEKFDYPVALGIDKGTDSKLKLSVQIARSDSSSESSSQSTKENIYTVDCESITSGISILDNFLSKKLNLSHCTTIIFSEELAKEGISEEINTLANNDQIRPDSNVLISSKTALDIIESASNSGENFSARYYQFIINSTDYTAYSIISRFGDIFYDFNNNKTQAIANYVTITEDLIQSDGIAVFKNDKMVGILESSNSIAHSIVTNKLDSATISIVNPFEENTYMDIEISLEKVDLDVEIINKTPYIKVNSDINGKIKSTTDDFNYSSIDNLKIVENALDHYLESLLSEYLYTISRKFNSDICYFGEILSTKYLTINEFDQIHWNEVFKDSVFDVSVNSKINSSYLFNKD